MNLRPLAIAGGIAIVITLALAGFAWVQVPAGAQVPIHWGVDGQPDGYASKEVALLLMPLVTAGLVALLYFLPRFEPRARNLAASGPAYLQVTIALLVVMVGVQLVVVLAAIGRPLDVTFVLGVGIGILFVVIGNVLGKVRSNFMFGVRTPWTLSSDLSWNKTHRLVGRLFVLLGFAVAITGLVGGNEALLAVLLGGIVVVLVVSFAYSYRVWKADPDKLKVGERA
jgi:immunity protein, SdpI family